MIHGFYEDMQNYFIRKVIIEDHKITDAAEIESVSAKFHDLSRSRFAQYGEKFQQDISDPLALSCPATVSYLLDNLFIQPITQPEKLQLMGAVSIKSSLSGPAACRILNNQKFSVVLRYTRFPSRSWGTRRSYGRFDIRELIDLHVHSTASDGSFPPAEVVRLAQAEA